MPRSGFGLFSVLLLLASSAPLGAQGGDGYLFRAPSAQITLRGGYANALPRGELFDQVTKDLTLDRSSLNGITGGATLALEVSRRVAVTFDADVAGVTGKRSEYRDFVDLNDDAIEQTTDFVRVPLLAGARLRLAEPGRSIGRLAWVPAGVVPWVGAGIGAMWYRFRQQGDFVDFNTNAVETLRVSSEGFTPAAQASAGADFTITPRLAITGDARYTWARAKLGQDFDQDFDRLDLSGVAFALGLTIRL